MYEIVHFFVWGLNAERNLAVKRILGIILTICVLSSALYLPVSAAVELDDGHALGNIEGYIELIIAIGGLIATIISVILLTSASKKENAKSKEKEE